MKRVAASVFLIFLGFALTACGSEEDKTAVTGAFAETEELRTGDGPVDNSHSGGTEADGRMLKPEGHKGMWFETEPTDPWEHYVWASQKFVGDPIELPKLEGKGNKDSLQGIPDICDSRVSARLKEIGFDQEESIDSPLIYTCNFYEVEPVNGSFSEALFQVSLESEKQGDSGKEVHYAPRREDVVPLGGGNRNSRECAISKNVNNGRLAVEILSGGSGSSVRELCVYSEYFFQIYDNIISI
ncbi:hypothetical protein [Corynebacterium jeikeium]|uniref:hypothetical protein n=1 Tax=Corynebacterium jeikeium TaxID=38289 RepID=UPI00088CAE9C|nr:hypothetical protein [Corynebacterium jeikeium]SCX12996.1 hypothetical protein CJBVI_0921 [Corynebacterium jeikeium]